MNLSNLLGSLRKKTFAATAVRPARRRPRLSVTTLEAREVPATLPAPIVDQGSFRSLDADGWAFSMKTDPVNPNQIFAAYVTHASNGTRVQYKVSTNGGLSWGTLGFRENSFDPVHTDAPIRFEEVGDPDVTWDRFGNVFVAYTEFHTDHTAGQLTVRKFQFSALSEVQAPRVLYRWFASSGIENVNIAVDNNLINNPQGQFQDPTVPGLAGRQTDPLAAAQTDKDKVRVFVTWNAQIVDDGGAAPAGFNPNPVIAAYSSDGGVTYSGSMLVNNDGYSAAGGPYSFSDIAFTPGRAGEANSGGRMVTAFSSNTGGPNNAPTIKTDTVSFAAAPTLMTFSPIDGGSYFINPLTGQPVENRIPRDPPSAGPIDDAIDNDDPDIDTPITTRFLFPVTALEAQTLGRVSDLWLTMRISGQELELSHYSARLISPTGASVRLFLNRTLENGDDRHESFGLAGDAMGGFEATTFTDSAFWTINTDNGVISPVESPYQGDFLPEGDPAIVRGSNPFRTAFGNLTPAQMTGDWRLEVTDHRADNTGSLTATLRISGGLGKDLGADRTLPNLATVAANMLGTDHPTKPAYAPTSGIAPKPVLAVDNTLGAFSPYQNRVYLTYGDGSVNVLYSDGVDNAGGQLWNTGPIGAGAGYLPQVTVDPATGTVVLAYYDPSFDASNTRSTMVMRTVVNMPDYKDRIQSTAPFELSAKNFVTPHEQAFDQIRSQILDSEPIPSNGTVASDERMWGNSFGLTVDDGRVKLVYPGNLNIRDVNRGETGSQLRTQDIVISTGPRVVGGDMGPVLGTASVTPLVWVNHQGVPNTNGFVPGRTTPGNAILYNQPVGGGDGRNSFSAFVVTFDRVIDPASFNTPADVKVIFRGPTADPVGPGTELAVASITPLDDIRDPLDDTPYGSKRFLVRLTTPQTNVGTYSYLIGSDRFTPGPNPTGIAALIKDRVKGPRVVYDNVGPPQPFSPPAAQLPVQIVDFNGTPNAATSSVTILPGAFPAGVVIGDVNVTVDIDHTQVSDLQLELVSPTGQVVRLVNAGDAQGLNFEGTTFDDQAGGTLGGDVAPYTGSYRPAGRLAVLFAGNTAGTWTLRATDLASGDTGVIVNWTITIQGVRQGTSVSTGNFIDQDADANENEVPFIDGNGLFNAQDGFAIPNPTTSSIPFRLPYVVGTLPVGITGPRLVSTNVPNQKATSTDNAVLNQAVTAIDLTFDRVIDGSMFNPKNVVRMSGVINNQLPLGDIPLTNITVTPVDAAGNPLPAGSNSRTFRISGFPAQSLSGTYTVQLTPQVLDPVSGAPIAQIKDTTGNLLDTNTNAGVGNLMGSVTGATVETQAYGGDIPGPVGNGVAIPAKGSVTVPLVITEAFLLKKASLNISIENFPGNSYRDLEGRLIAPDGTSVLLFARAPETGAGDMKNIILTDDAFYSDPLSGQPRQISPIEDGVQAGGRYNPTQPFQPLINHASQGTWKLVIKNLGTQTGLVKTFKLFLDKPVISSGLGEEIADRVTASFRIARVDASQDIAKDNWTPVGPAPHIDVNVVNSTAGRVSSIAVDPSDPSGNTVYAAGASGGVWRTNNFLTRDPDGPNWIPLADFGPNNAINVGFLAVYNSPTDPRTNGDPNKTVILVGTGSQALNVIDAEDQRRFDGVGFLISEDAGKTWEVLDSTNNFNAATQSYRGVVDPSSTTYTIQSATQTGNTVTIRTTGNAANPHEFRRGMEVQISGVSVAGYNGTFVITGATDSTFTYTTTATGLAAGSGGTARALDRRDHLFVGAVVNKVVFEKNPDAFTNRPIIWAAVGRGSTPAASNIAGLWRSNDGGRSWTQVRQGEATDFVLAPGSQLPNSGDRPTFGYLALQGEGVFFTSNLNAPNPSFAIMNGGVGRPTVNTGSIPVAASETPNGAFGKITLASPFFVNGSPLANNYYQRWLYAAVSNTDGTFRGLYMSKDRGLNWTKLRVTDTGGFSTARPDVDITLNPNAPGGNHSLSLAVDPNDPNIVYFGSNALIRVDATFVADPYNLTMYTHNDDAGGIRPDTAEGVVDADATLDVVGGGLIAFDPNFFPPLPSSTPTTVGYQGDLTADPRKKWNHLNLDRDPYRQFRRDTAISVTNVASFTNDGSEVTWTLPGGQFGNGIRDYNWVSQIFTLQDPLTGRARVIVGSDEGIISYVSNPNGSNMEVNGFFQDFQVPDVGSRQSDLQITGPRNGNLQVARLYSGDSQPSLLAANIADSLLYGAARRFGDVPASPADPGDGLIVWDDSPGQVGRPGTANYVAADQTGTGNVYILRRINDMSPVLQNPVNFFQISKNGGPPVSFTNGLFQSNADAQGAGQWTNQVKVFAVNPVDANGIIMGSAAGRLFGTTDMALNWNPKGDPAALDGSISTALAFGAPRPNATDLNQYLYYGSQNGNIFVTTDAGGDTGTNWLNITTGTFGTLDGSAIQKIVPSPIRGSNELFAVTRDGIYRMANWDRRDPTDSTIRMPTPWEDITSNIKDITTIGFAQSDWEVPLLSATNPIMTIAVDWRPTYGPQPANPILYVGGDGGVFTARYNGDQTRWTRYTGPQTEGAASPGGGLPVVKVTDLDLALGDIDPSSGRPKSTAAPGTLIATTLGRGTWAIGLDVPAGVSGPRVVDSTPDTLITSGTGFSQVTVTFDQFISASSFTASDVVMTLPNGTTVNPVADPVDVTPPNQSPGTVWRMTFPTQTADGVYTIKVGPNVASGNVEMDQNGNKINGEPGDAFTFSVVIGRNDLSDYVTETFTRLLGRAPTTAEFTGAVSTAANPQAFGKTIPNMVSARLAALGAVVKELLTTFNGNEVRNMLVTRLFNNGGAANEIGHLLPTYVLSGSERDFLVAGLRNGTRTPESIVVYIMTKSEYSGLQIPAAAFLDKLYRDLFKGTTVTFDKLPAATQTAQLNQAATLTGRHNLIRSLVSGVAVKWNHDGNATTAEVATYDHDGNPATAPIGLNFRNHVVVLGYRRLLGREATVAEVTAGKALLARPLANGSLQGSEWLNWKILSSQEYFNQQTQAEGLPDDLLHTNRSWVNGVILDMARRASTPAERTEFSQKVLDRFKTQRAAFVRAVVNSDEYRTREITKYYQQVLLRNPTGPGAGTELTTWLSRMRSGTTLTGVVSNLLGTTEYYTRVTTATNTVPAKNQEWARAVYQTLLGRLPTAAEQSALVAKIPASGRAGASVSVLNSTDSTNGPTWRDLLITEAFTRALNRAATPAERTAYLNFLKTNRWENLYVDIAGSGAVDLDPATAGIQNGLVREYWEIAH